MDIIEKAIMKEMTQVFDEDETVNLRVHLNELEVISYFDKKYISVFIETKDTIQKDNSWRDKILNGSNL